MMIEDWEIGMLYWKCLELANGDEQKALDMVRKKYLGAFSNKVRVNPLFRYHSAVSRLGIQPIRHHRRLLPTTPIATGNPILHLALLSRSLKTPLSKGAVGVRLL